MKKNIELESYHFGGSNGVISCGVCFNLENENYIIPSSVSIKMNGEKLFPTSFDEHGNPRIDGIADLIFTWKKRQMVRDGLIESQYSKLNAECEYEIATKYFEIPIEDRISKMNVCPMCGRKFTLNELKNDLEDYENVLFHKKCLKEFLKLKMIDEITERFRIGLMYKYEDLKWKKDIDCTLIPNEYCSQSCCSHRPWFLFSSPYGKIKIGWRKRVISITFLEDFKDLDFDKLFAEEDVTKGKYNGKYNIHAWGYEKLYEYLKIVTETINK